MTLTILLGVTFAQLVGFPREAGLVAETHPELKLLVVPSVTWGALAALCWQGAAVLVLSLIVRMWNRRLSGADRGIVRGTLGCLGAFLTLALAAFIALSVMGLTTPGVMYGLIAGILLAALISIVALLALASVGPATRLEPSQA